MKILMVSAAVFLTILCLIFVVRAIFFFALNQAYKNYKKLKKLAAKNQKSPKKFVKEEEELRRKFEIPRANSAVKAEIRNQKRSNNYEMIQSTEQDLDRHEMNQVEIVDFVKPIGFWTSMILGQKLTFLIQSAHVLNKRGNKGFWVSMIEAKDRSAGRQQGR